MTLSPAIITVLLAKSIFIGFMVGFIEETWFRGALQSSVTLVSNSVFAILFLCCFSGAMRQISLIPVS